MTYTPTPFAGELDALPLYVQDELAAIAGEFQQRGGAASLFETVAGPLIQVGLIPTPLEFNAQTPVRYEVNIEAELPSALWLQTPGIWCIGFTIEAAIETQGTYEVRLYVDNVPTDLLSVIDPSNQTTIVTFAAIGSQRIDFLGERRELTLQVTADQDTRNWQHISGYFTAWWASD